MKLTTLCFLHDEKRILLAMKKRGFGAGRWNGFGGKLMEGETVEDATIREAKEEIGVDIAKKHLKKVAILNFTFPSKPEWNQSCHTFLVKKWKGEPTESEEMKPEWYNKDKIPFDKMWEDDILWIPKVLSGEKIEAHFKFDANQKMDKDFTMEPLLE